MCFSDGLFRVLAEVIGHPALANDPEFATNAARNRNEDKLRALIADWASGLTQSKAIAVLLDRNIPAAPVWDLRQLIESDHVNERHLVVHGLQGKLGTVPLVPQPARMSNGSGPETFTSPTLGEHTDAVLKQLADLTDAEIAELRSSKTI